MAAIRNTIKIIKLAKLEKILKQPANELTAEQRQEQDTAKEKLITLIWSCRDLRKVLEKAGKTKDDLCKIYPALCECSGVAKKQYVPAQALCFRHSLKYVIDNEQDLLAKGERSKVIGWVLTTYFERRDIFTVNEKAYLMEQKQEEALRKKREADREALNARLAERDRLKAEKKRQREERKLTKREIIKEEKEIA